MHRFGHRDRCFFLCARLSRFSASLSLCSFNRSTLTGSGASRSWRRKSKRGREREGGERKEGRVSCLSTLCPFYYHCFSGKHGCGEDFFFPSSFSTKQHLNGAALSLFSARRPPRRSRARRRPPELPRHPAQEEREWRPGDSSSRSGRILNALGGGDEVSQRR